MKAVFVLQITCDPRQDSNVEETFVVEGMLQELKGMPLSGELRLRALSDENYGKSRLGIPPEPPPPILALAARIPDFSDRDE